MANFLTRDVPLWVALLLAGVATWIITRPVPEPDPVVVYVDREIPAKPRVPARPEQIFIYQPVMDTQVVTIEIPVIMDRYHLVQRDMIGRTRQGGIRISAYDPIMGRFEDWVFNPRPVRFRAYGQVNLAQDVLSQNLRLSTRLDLSYKRVGLFAQAGVDLQQIGQPHVHVGLSYHFMQRSW